MYIHKPTGCYIHKTNLNIHKMFLCIFSAWKSGRARSPLRLLVRAYPRKVLNSEGLRTLNIDIHTDVAIYADVVPGCTCRYWKTSAGDWQRFGPGFYFGTDLFSASSLYTLWHWHWHWHASLSSSSSWCLLLPLPLPLTPLLRVYRPAGIKIAWVPASSDECIGKR